MKKRLFAIVLLASLLLCLCSCSKVSGDSTFSIRFIDVGQGDAALVECDGHYMLIDGGDTAAGDAVYNALVEQGVRQIDILAISHLHSDHIGGLPEALKYITKIGITISNEKNSSTKIFTELESELIGKKGKGSRITIPSEGDKYELGSATVEVVYAGADSNNDSLVLLITYGNTRFLFTGDIEGAAETSISDKYQNESDEPFKIDLIKMPHHGSYAGTLYRFLRTFMPDYIIISVGAGNQYGHPHQKTLDLLDSKTWQPKIYRTDIDGDITVKSNGKEIEIVD